jgi:PAS domain S-box-containing protein
MTILGQRPSSTHIQVAWNAVVNNIDDGIILLDGNRKAVEANLAAANLIGLPVRQMLGHTPDHIFADHPRLLSLCQDLMRDDRPSRSDEAPLGSDDGEAFVDLRVIPLLGDEDNLTGYMLLLQDITARKHAQLLAARRMAELAALRNVDWRISSTLNIEDVLQIALSSAMRTSSADAGFISMMDDDQNQRIVQAAGAYSPQLVGEAFPSTIGIIKRVVTSGDAQLVLDVRTDPDYYEDIPDTRAQMTIPLIFQDRMVGILNLETTRPGNFKPEVFEFVKVLAGRIAMAMENARLYTVSQQQLAELQELYEQVQELEQLKTDMIRIASHDLLNPLSTIMGYISLLQGDGDQLSGEHQDYINTMMELAERMEHLISDILSLEHIQQNAVTLTALDLAPLVTGVAENHRQMARRKNLSLAFSVPEGKVMIQGNLPQLQEAVVNLVTNAIKYTPTGGSVEIALRRLKGRAEVTVTDTGYGIPEELQGRLFQPFYRAVSEETTSISGTGLGLHLIKNIIDRHHGRVIFHSVHGEGSTFGFELPLLRDVPDSP